MRALHQVLRQAQCIYFKKPATSSKRALRPAPASSSRRTPNERSVEANEDRSSSESPSSFPLMPAPVPDIQQSTSVMSSTTTSAPHNPPKFVGWQTALEALGPVDRLLAVCRNTRMASFFLQPSTPPSFLQAFFPSFEDLQCFHHCVTYSFSIIVVTEDHNPWVERVAPLFMTSGQDDGRSSGAALKMSMLYMGAVHLSYLQGRDGNSTASMNTRTLALGYRKDCLRLLRLLSGKQPPTCDAAFLSACALTLTADLLGANPRWRELMRIVKGAIEGNGGMDMIICFSAYVDPAIKCAVESLVNLSMLATFSAGIDNCILSSGLKDEIGRPIWWTMLVEAETIQSELCGISRSLVSLYATLSSFLITIEDSSQIDPTRADQIESDWNLWLITEGAVEMDERVKAGSMAFWQAGKISILRKIRKASRSDDSVQTAAMAILEICASVGDKVEYMNWPMIIACSTFTDPISRDTARAQLKLFVSQCCYEIEVIQMVCEEMWSRMDEGEDEQACGWVEILLESGLPVLLG
uniref:Uncharacterized protein n=1 Tax=Kwoniella bestiolae CBS 10118 TaxID=1296100 RepID=A0A1B9FS70_9TREE|nr:hypothetical protein I302_08391 [Kwoniella bestiolae CBS 10118]OCF21616.1 hypothetical protein I302_08391 [Kwoniella bestiolae CBS 10118]